MDVTFKMIIRISNTCKLNVMKKSICILLVLIGFSAFAFSPNYSNGFSRSVKKVSTKKASKQGATPLTDLVSFPF